LHVSNRAADTGVAGERCALNLAGAEVSKQALARGSWLVEPGFASQTTRFDMSLDLLESEPRPLAQWTSVHVHCGASAMLGRVVLLGQDRLAPGGRSLAQIVLPGPLPVRHFDRIVLRDTSAVRTIGGGRVLDPRAPARKRQTPERLARLEALDDGDPAAALSKLAAIDPGFEDLSAFAQDWPLDDGGADTLAAGLGLLLLQAGAQRFAVEPGRLRRVADAIKAVLTTFHAEHPELPGMAIEHVRLALAAGLSRPLFQSIVAKLTADGRLTLHGHWLRLPGHQAKLGEEDEKLWRRMRPLIAKDPFKPPRVRDLAMTMDVPEQTVRRACKALVRMGELIEVAHDHFFQRATVAAMAQIAAKLSRPEKPEFSASEFRDQLENGRKVAIQILEFFDRHGLTLRRGDVRRTVKDPSMVFGMPNPPARLDQASESVMT
jgi:selenocysteine-specific elongation factor